MEAPIKAFDEGAIRGLGGRDLPLNLHPAAVRASAGFTPSGAGGAMCGRPDWSGLPGRPRIAARLPA